MADDVGEIIEAAWAERASLSPRNVTAELGEAIETCIAGLDDGSLRIAERRDPTALDSEWVVNEWLKKAVLLFFRIHDNAPVDAGYTRFFDKVPLKYADYDAAQFTASGTRVVPDAIVRRGAYIAPDVVLMPSYVNIGAYVDTGSMIDTWATVGSCAQIGKRVHLSGGAGIGGVLEPLQATPTIIEDDCFIGARSEIVEGVIVGKGSVIAMGVYISQSTRIFDRETGETSFGRVPPGSVVVPGSLPSKDGSYNLACAVIVKRVDEKTRAKTSLNELLRSVEP